MAHKDTFYASIFTFNVLGSQKPLCGECDHEDYDGDTIDPVWVDVEDLSTIERFGFTKEEIMAL